MKKLSRWFHWSNGEFFSEPSYVVYIDGDPRAVSPRWWNWWYLVWRGWKKVAIFEVSPEVAALGYHIHYLPIKGSSDSPKACIINLHLRRFGMLIGDGRCAFWITSNLGDVATTLPLTLYAFTDRDRPNRKYKDVPLI